MIGSVDQRYAGEVPRRDGIDEGLRKHLAIDDKPDQNAEKPGMVPSYQFICQAREPIVFKQPEQEMLPIARWTPTMSAAVK